MHVPLTMDGLSSGRSLVSSFACQTIHYTPWFISQLGGLKAMESWAIPGFNSSNNFNCEISYAIQLQLKRFYDCLYVVIVPCRRRLEIGCQSRNNNILSRGTNAPLFVFEE